MCSKWNKGTTGLSETNTVKAKETGEILTRRYREKTKHQDELNKLHVDRTEGNEELTRNIKTEVT